MEIVFVVDEVYLHACRRNGRHLDHERPVDIVDYDVHAGKADHLVKLVLSFIDAAVSRHEGPYLLLPLLDSLRKVSSDICYVRFREIREYLRIDEQDSFDRISHSGCF